MKVIFTMVIEHVIDLITNSSSELFVLRGKTKESIIQVLDAAYKSWREEYGEPKNVSDLTLEEINTYFSYACSPHIYPASRHNYPILSGFTFDELYEEDKSEWRQSSWGGTQYTLRNNKKSENEWDRDFVVAGNRDEIISKLCPERNMWFLFSFDDNPNFDGQDNLSRIASRYHLG